MKSFRWYCWAIRVLILDGKGKKEKKVKWTFLVFTRKVSKLLKEVHDVTHFFVEKIWCNFLIA